MRNGVVVGEFAAPQKFKYYNNGVLTDEQKPAHLGQTSSDSPVDYNLLQIAAQSNSKIASMDLNHSVAILGWGKDPKSGNKVWIVRNSFGPNWGEHGDLYIRRG